MTVRIEKLRKKVEELGYDAYLATDEMNVRYLTGIAMPQAPCLLIKLDGDSVFYVLSDNLRAAESIAGKYSEIKAADIGQPSLDLLIKDLPGMDLGRIGVDTLSAEAYLKLTEKVKKTTFILNRAPMWALRMIKSKEEIAYIRRAAEIADEGHKTAVEVLKPGMREYEVAAEMEHAMRVLGSEDEGHRTVVSSGPRTLMALASGFTTDRKINKGELVMIDSGATINGYRSDLGRPYVVGKPTPKQKERYELLEKGWEAAFACLKPGAIAGDVDAAARKVYGKYEKLFYHEIGHGLGLSFEPPDLIKNGKDVLKENMVVTVEPGLYFDDVGGMYLEGMNLIVKDGAKRLNRHYELPL